MISPSAAACQPGSCGILHGIPSEHEAALSALLAEARRMRDAGRTRAEVLARVLVLNRALPKRLPLYSAGGLVETVEALLAVRPEVSP
jgi:hypothetical protein